ncbi:MAG: hypothetical protein IH912_09380 [Proteobacteria bacterium]|nr:hypothetical protein [Pseudomonadota bacterium]
MQARHGEPSPDLDTYDERRPVLAVDLGQEEVICPVDKLPDAGKQEKGA